LPGLLLDSGSPLRCGRNDKLNCRVINGIFLESGHKWLPDAAYTTYVEGGYNEEV